MTSPSPRSRSARVTLPPKGRGTQAPASAGSDSREAQGEGRRITMLRDRAKDALASQTPAEHRLWQLLRAHRFAGYKFKRQLAIDDYIADFVCFERRLIVEADGGQHCGKRVRCACATRT